MLGANKINNRYKIVDKNGEKIEEIITIICQ